MLSYCWLRRQATDAHICEKCWKLQENKRGLIEGIRGGGECALVLRCAVEMDVRGRGRGGLCVQKCWDCRDGVR